MLLIFKCLFVLQNPASVSKVTGWLSGWYHSSHADLSSGHGASEDGCNAKGNVRPVAVFFFCQVSHL